MMCRYSRYLLLRNTLNSIELCTIVICYIIDFKDCKANKKINSVVCIIADEMLHFKNENIVIEISNFLIFTKSITLCKIKNL